MLPKFISLSKVKKVLSIFLSFLLLFSNLGFSMNTHFCGGEPIEKSVSLGTEMLSCGMESEDSSCGNSGSLQNSFNAVPCCKDINVFLQVDDELRLKWSNSSFQNLNLVAVLPSYNFIAISKAKIEFAFIKYTPPLIKKNIQVLFQSFLI